MTIQEYFDKYPALSSSNAYLERRFVQEVFFPDYGENGLDLLVSIG